MTFSHCFLRFFLPQAQIQDLFLFPAKVLRRILSLRIRFSLLRTLPMMRSPLPSLPLRRWRPLPTLAAIKEHAFLSYSYCMMGCFLTNRRKHKTRLPYKARFPTIKVTRITGRSRFIKDTILPANQNCAYKKTMTTMQPRKANFMVCFIVDSFYL